DANRKPTRTEIRNCSTYLRRVFELIDPPIVATLGSVALDAIKTIDPHTFTLRENAGRVFDWNGRKLIPLYHPSPQVIAAQRGLDLQLSHFGELSKLI
ncbi:MAG: uracil-DNA glycosylase family protein, partial [Pyrinomonadaceae bacterium]